MIRYDPKIIQQFANGLYALAARIVAIHTFIGCIIGGGAGYALDNSNIILAIVGAAIIGWIGYDLGTQKAFGLKLQAQMALCQVQIEKNTRSLNDVNEIEDETVDEDIIDDDIEFVPPEQLGLVQKRNLL